MNLSNNSRKQRRLELTAMLAPLVGLAGTIYGIIRAFQNLDNKDTNNLIFSAVLDAVIVSLEVTLTLLLALVVWHWFSNK